VKRLLVLVTVVLAASVAARSLGAPFVAIWLVAWWWALGIVMGALASLWVWMLTGGEWGDALRPHCLRLGSAMPALALLAIPLAVGVPSLYPWAQPGGAWVVDLTAPAFKVWWLTPGFVYVRGGLLLALWVGLAWLTRRPGLQRSHAFATAALIAWTFSASVGAVDWLMSLMPRWSSAGFGLVVIAGQGLGGLAAAVALRRGPASAKLGRDLGNLLLAWLMVWAWLEFVQFQVIWAEDLPREIVWYAPRLSGVGAVLGGLLVVAGFALPFMVLLFRGVKQHSPLLRAVAAGLVGVHGLQVAWWVLPSIAGASHGG
jgi:hypothetical protein